MRYVRLALVLVVATGLSASPRQDSARGRERESPVRRVVKRLVGSLGNFLIIPTPTPPPPQSQP
jgi:hypothetical protein